MKKEVVAYNGIDIRFDGELINLTHMWRAAGGSKNQMPLQWLRLPSTVKFLNALCKKLNVGLSHILGGRCSCTTIPIFIKTLVYL